MPIQQQELSLTTKKLHLAKERAFKHFLDPLIMLGISFFFFFLIAKSLVNKNGHFDSPYFLIFLIFPVIAFLFYINQSRLLRLKEIETNYYKYDNYKIAKDTLNTLGWHIRVDNKDFIEAYTDNFGFWTWTDQMISILIADKKILFNSIGNVDTYATQAFSWGQHSRNMKQFQKTFELMATKQSS